MLTKDFDQDFNLLKTMLEENRPFAFTRFSDGEMFILQNKKLILAEDHFITGEISGRNKYTVEELKSFLPERDQDKRRHLVESYKFNSENYFKGIPTKAEGHVGDENFKYMIDLLGGDFTNLTFANLLINGNYKRFVEEIIPILSRKKVYYIVNEKAELDNIPFDLEGKFLIGNDCMNRNYNLTSDLPKFISKNKIKNCVFLFSAASLSNLLIYEAHKIEPDNTYLDIGSCLNPLLNLEGWRYTRGYLLDYWTSYKNKYGTMKDVWSL
jgi:hypothetical protein